MIKLLITIPVLCLSLLFPPVQADSAGGLYSAEVRVASQSKAARLQGISVALGKVLVKVTGKESAETATELASLRGSAADFVQQFTYSERLAGSGPDSGTQKYLSVVFDKSVLDRALADYSYQAWGVTRPQTLLWLAVSDTNGRSILGASDDGPLSGIVNRASTNRGMPVFLPLLDIEDRRQLPFSDLWGNFESSIHGASARYGADVILVGRVERYSSKRWSGRWVLYQPNGKTSWDSRGATLRDAVSQGLNHSFNRLVESFAPTQSGSDFEQVQVRIQGLHGLESFSSLMQYLDNVSLIKSIRPVQVERGVAVLDLNLNGSQSDFTQVLQLGKVLQRVDDMSGASLLVQDGVVEPIASPINPDLTYHYLR